MIDRKIPPPIHTITTLTLPHPKVARLDNGIEVFILDYPDFQITKLEITYQSGRLEEHQRMVSRATARMIREGTPTMDSATIAEHIDFYGGTFSIPTNLDFSSFSLFCVKKYFKDLLPVFADTMLNPSFPAEELENFKRTHIQELKVDLEKAEVVAYRKITELIFGTDHPYGYNSMPEDYEKLTSSDLKRHFDDWYVPFNSKIFVSGGVDEEILNLLNMTFGKVQKTSNIAAKIPIVSNEKPQKVVIPQENSLQSAIKIGRKLFNKSHPDFNGMFVLNTILGGYFGSRLMTNIREKKGLTYNIYSTVDSMQHDGCFYIATEVSPETVDATRKEIWRELKKLREKPVPEEELEMVRNYLLGMLLNGLDGAMNTSDIVKTLIMDGLSLETFQELVNTIKTINSEAILTLSQRYFQPKDFWEVQVG
jgi:zinc protease